MTKNYSVVSIIPLPPPKKKPPTNTPPHHNQQPTTTNQQPTNQPTQHTQPRLCRSKSSRNWRNICRGRAKLASWKTMGKPTSTQVSTINVWSQTKTYSWFMRYIHVKLILREINSKFPTLKQLYHINSFLQISLPLFNPPPLFSFWRSPFLAPLTSYDLSIWKQIATEALKVDFLGSWPIAVDLDANPPACWWRSLVLRVEHKEYLKHLK